MRGIESRSALIHGDDVEAAIVRYIKEAGADAVFVNAQRELGKVKRDIIRKIDVPVMIVPAQQPAA
jgi:2-methylisocitrate lyase-like PEP mutase family enzyme